MNERAVRLDPSENKILRSTRMPPDYQKSGPLSLTPFSTAKAPAQLRCQAAPAYEPSAFASIAWDDVGIDKPISLHDITEIYLDALLKHRPADNNCVKLSVLSARVNPRGKFLEQFP
jgi:hypothetical protein